MKRAWIPTLLLGLSLLAAPLAAGAEAVFLRNLSSGTKLVAKRPVLIRANEGSTVLGSSAGTTCYLRVRESRPFDRLVRSEQELRISGVRRAGFSYRHTAVATTYVELDSRSMQDIVCRTHGALGETTLDEFSNALAGSFRITPAPAPQDID